MIKTRRDELYHQAQNVMFRESECIELAGKMLSYQIVDLAEKIHMSSGNVVITGMGKSGDIGKKIASTLSSIGVFSYYLHPTEALHGDLGRIREGDIIIALTHSGETQEVIDLLDHIDQMNIKYTLAVVTSNSKSTISKRSSIKILTHVKNEVRKKKGEYFMTPTSSTTVTLAIGDSVACMLQDLMDFQPKYFKKFHPGGNLGKILDN